MLVQEVKFDLTQKQIGEIRAVQGDTDREIHFIASDINGPISNDDYVYVFVLNKPDHTFIIQTLTDGVLILDEQMTVITGTLYYCVRIEDRSTGKIIYSAQGDFIVDDALISEDDVESVAEVNGMTFPDDYMPVNLRSGNPIEIDNSADAPIYRCTVNFMYKQAGTGDPSPDNIRPITPYSDIDIDITDSSTGTPTTHNIDFGGTYGGGYIDVVHGKLVVTHYYEVYDGTATVGFGRNGQSNWYYTITGTVIPGTLGIIPISNKYVGNNVTNTNDKIGIYKIPNLGQVRVRIGGTQPADTSSFIADLSNTPLQLVCPLDIPIEISLTPAQIRTLNGSNYITTTGDSMEIAYFTITYQALIDLIEGNI